MDKIVPTAWLEAGLSLTPSLARKQTNGQSVQIATPEQIKFSQNDAARIINAMQSHRQFVTDEALKRLAQCHFAFVPYRLFGAHAAYDDGREVIVLFEGLLEVMMATLEMSYTVSGFPDELDAVYPIPDYPDVSAAGWAAVLFVRLIYGFAAREEPQPNFQALLHSERDTELHFGLIGGLWVTLLHELGHHVHGHVTARNPVARAASEADLLVAEELTRYQRYEIEADRYSFYALTEQGKTLHMSWVNTALGAQMMFDSLLTERKDTHPLSVNRLERLLREYKYSADTFGHDNMAAHLERHARLYTKTEQEHLRLRTMNIAPLIAGLDHQEVENLIISLAPSFEDYGIDLMEVFSAQVKDWRYYLQQSSIPL